MSHQDRRILVLDLYDTLFRATATHWASQGVRYFPAPVTTGSVSSPMGLGSDSVPVDIELFGERTFLADSMQFYLEYGCRLASRGCWYFMPSFRGEEPDARHLNQFMHSEVELPGDLDLVMSAAWSYVRTLARTVHDEHADRLPRALAVAEVADLPEPLRMEHSAAVESLRSLPGATVHLDETTESVTPLGERTLLDRHGPAVWLTHFDTRAVPFYQAVSVDRATTETADLLLGVGEVLGAGARHSTAPEVEAAMRSHGVDPAPYAWYVDMKRVSPMTTGGFGLGIERFIQWVLAEDDVRNIPLISRLRGEVTYR